MQSRLSLAARRNPHILKHTRNRDALEKQEHKNICNHTMHQPLSAVVEKSTQIRPYLNLVFLCFRCCFLSAVSPFFFPPLYIVCSPSSVYFFFFFCLVYSLKCSVLKGGPEASHIQRHHTHKYNRHTHTVTALRAVMCIQWSVPTNLTNIALASYLWRIANPA